MVWIEFAEIWIEFVLRQTLKNITVLVVLQKNDVWQNCAGSGVVNSAVKCFQTTCADLA